ncbi:hypothetical protein GlitD10_0996 [Gloeomargarita lithophora Alchichica-D10]|uniref:Toxin n=1 Tax=Gloeomargarita lithophora Alchichica-D10 TaxID=1188229 RepID=A0A1J0ABK1_9CYAN|nr:BrnT family toxin [Gloeomargarita lithophora]APB33314.1 hypothetical protein GlitD10_0996 [Gloeomargarita lithophora Alchichica-D10]
MSQFPDIFLKEFRWNPEKNQHLKEQRGISFEIILLAIQMGKLLDVIEHPNPERYPNQRIFVVEIKNYVYLVPFVEDATSVFLKTIIPSRKMKSRYLRE